MISTLIHSTLVSDSQSEKGEENRKHYQNLIKKLKKVRRVSFEVNFLVSFCLRVRFLQELGDRTSPSIQQLRQLLPLPKVQHEVVACEQLGAMTDTKGNRIAGFDSIDKKQVNLAGMWRALRFSPQHIIFSKFVLVILMHLNTEDLALDQII